MSQLAGTERAHLNFCFTLHRVLAAHGGDSCFSPYSIASALGLVSRAARGPAADEVVALLTGGDPDIAKHAELLRDAAALGEPTGGEAPVLGVSNTLWVWADLPLNEAFPDELATWPGGTVATAPFVADPEGARRVINTDVERATRGLIPELLPPGTVDPDTVASIVNALYLKVAWAFPFPEAETELADFHAPGGTRQVPTMRQAERLGYAAHAGWQLVELPAVGGVSATILLPDGDLAEQESTLDDSVLAELLSAKQDTMVTLALPKFELDVRAELTTALKELGVRTMFTTAADFAGLTDDPRIVVSDVLHQAVLRIDEQGLEGAAATAAMMRLVSMPITDPVTVEVDRPFLLLVRHATTGMVYFFARVVRP
ncbi:serpin family protein [Amycolatopsis anabasis]|uniref:serpin family protein n=1 Tax=Amycolatopsis anabasis TaxID=1840409 RepID=UPI00131C87CF|nr:serpin family protein [Amycolatopsis anabasis]